MDTSEWLTRGTVWLALSLYVAAEVAKVANRGDEFRISARLLNSLGCAAFLAHVACAFYFYHAWSHSLAYADTARRTEDFVGWNWGGGLYINYLFAVVWLGEVIWSSAKPSHSFARPQWMTWTVRCFFLFMMLNGAVLFVRGVMRWFGLMLCLTLVGCWWLDRKRMSDSPDPAQLT